MEVKYFLLLIPLFWVFPVYFVLQEHKRKPWAGIVGKVLYIIFSPFVFSLPTGMVMTLISWLWPGMTFLEKRTTYIDDFEFFFFLPQIIIFNALTALIIAGSLYFIYRKIWPGNLYILVGGAFMHIAFITSYFTIGPNLHYILNYSPEPEVVREMDAETDHIYRVSFVHDKSVLYSMIEPMAFIYKMHEGLQGLEKGSDAYLDQLHKNAKSLGRDIFKENLPRFADDNLTDYLNFQIEKLGYLKRKDPEACGFILFGGGYKNSYKETFLDLTEMTRKKEDRLVALYQDTKTPQRAGSKPLGVVTFEKLFLEGLNGIKETPPLGDLNFEVFQAKPDLNNEENLIRGCSVYEAYYRYIGSMPESQKIRFYRTFVLRDLDK